MHRYLRRPSTALAASFILLNILFNLTACAKSDSSSELAADPGLQPAADKMIKSAACGDFEDRFWNTLYDFPLQHRKLPSAGQMESQLKNSFAMGARTSASNEALRTALTDLYKLVAVDAVQVLGLNGKTDEEVLSELTALELGDQDTPEKAELQVRLQDQFAQVQKQAEASGMACEAESEAVLEQIPDLAPDLNGQTLFGKWKATRHPAVFGGLKVMATAYQSCEAAAQPALTAEDPDTQGIAKTTMHRDHIGWYRVISDLQALLRTDYYLQNYRRPASSCFDVTEKPLIYNYGGRPAATNTTASTLDLFKIAGAGGRVLGVDCSGFVFTSLASAGLKVSPHSRLKAISVLGTSARKFMNPQLYGYSCLKPAVFKGDKSIQEGDVLASTGHVVIVDEVGKDPFGILEARSEADCAPAKMSLDQIDFTVLQSSSYKNGIGINRAKASDFFTTEPALAQAMIDHAVTACLAHVRGTQIASHSTSAAFVRHTRTANCLDREVKLEHESCLANCPAM